MDSKRFDNIMGRGSRGGVRCGGGDMSNLRYDFDEPSFKINHCSLLHCTAYVLRIYALHCTCTRQRQRRGNLAARLLTSELLGLARAARRAAPCAAHVPFGLNICLCKTTKIL